MMLLANVHFLATSSYNGVLLCLEHAGMTPEQFSHTFSAFLFECPVDGAEAETAEAETASTVVSSTRRSPHIISRVANRPSTLEERPEGSDGLAIEL